MLKQIQHKNRHTNIRIWAEIPPHMLTKQTKQSQRHQESLPLPVGVILVVSLTRSALCLNPVSGLGVGVSSLDREGGHWPTGLRLCLQLCLQFPLPLPSLLLSKAPAKKASPSPHPSTGRGAQKRGPGSLGRKKTRPHADHTHTAGTSPEPAWKCVHVHQQV